MRYMVIISAEVFASNDEGKIFSYPTYAEIAKRECSNRNEVAHFLELFNLNNPKVRYEVYEHIEEGEMEEIADITDKFYVFPFASVMYEE